MASDFRTAIYPVMRKRHWDSIELTLETSCALKNGQTDDEIVMARIQQRNFAPNVAPIKPSLQQQPPQPIADNPDARHCPKF